MRQGCNFITVQNTGGNALSWSKLLFTLSGKIKGDQRGQNGEIKGIREDRRPCSNLRRYVGIILGACLGQQVTSDSLCLRYPRFRF